MGAFTLILIFIIEYLKYCLGLKLLFKEKIKRLLPFFVGFIIYIFIMTSKGFSEYEIRLIMFMIVIAILIMSIDSKTHHRIIHILISIFIITCLDGVTVMPVHYILENYKDSISTSNLEYLICSNGQNLKIQVQSSLRKPHTSKKIWIYSETIHCINICVWLIPLRERKHLLHI